MSTYCVRGGVNQGRRSGWGSNIRTQGGRKETGQPARCIGHGLG